MDSPDSYRGKFLKLFDIMHFVYIIQSMKDESFYIGKTADMESRLIWHNSLELNQGVTKRKIPWKNFFILEVKSSTTTGKIENHIKRMKSRKYILNLTKYPEMGQKLIEKYS